MVQRAPRSTGVICILKDSFGFIMLASKDEQVYFNMHDWPLDADAPHQGDAVEFDLSVRQGKGVATKLRPLPPGSVTFEHVDDVPLRGTVARPPVSRNLARGDLNSAPGLIEGLAADG